MRCCLEFIIPVVYETWWQLYGLSDLFSPFPCSRCLMPRHCQGPLDHITDALARLQSASSTRWLCWAIKSSMRVHRDTFGPFVSVTDMPGWRALSSSGTGRLVVAPVNPELDWTAGLSTAWAGLGRIHCSECLQHLQCQHNIYYDLYLIVAFMACRRIVTVQLGAVLEENIGGGGNVPSNRGVEWRAPTTGESILCIEWDAVWEGHRTLLFTPKCWCFEFVEQCFMSDDLST